MELVYLWVENYKNIQKQGFNFSPRFRCEYDEKTNELKVVDKDEMGEFYPKNFFGDNINITAIVGENGSGKSSLMEFLLDLFDSESAHKFLLLYLYENKPRYYSYQVSSSNINELKINNFKIEEQLVPLLNRYGINDGHENLISLYINNEYTNIDSRPSEQFFTESSKKSLSVINSLIIKNSLKLRDISIKVENYFIPTKVNIKLKEIDFFTSILDKDREFYTDIVWNKIITLKSQLKDTTLLKKIELVREIFKVKREEFSLIDEKPAFLGKKKDKSYFKFEYRDFGNTVPAKITENLITGNVHSLNIYDINEEVLSFLYELPKEFDIELEDEKRKFSKLSFGERQLLILMNNILKIFLMEKYVTYYDYDYEKDEAEKCEHNINEVVLFIDEFELGLHPNWQKRFFSYFREISKFTNKKIHLIITSHSPFLLSDLPKENIIFLEKGKQVYPFDDGKQTFGANIHTLLSHGFFMKDGLMGEFAKDKIDDVIKYLNNDKTSTITTDKDAQNIIDIIGEPIIKRELQRMLKNKMELSNKTEIDTIKDEIKLLTERLEKLEPKDEK
ncbi:MAG: AAA family ATPase [Aliarcobacter sp.]|nr:AAA family ATPase [Aliarcobacter sp.]